jgi:hypothetical protein
MSAASRHGERMSIVRLLAALLVWSVLAACGGFSRSESPPGAAAKGDDESATARTLETLSNSYDELAKLVDRNSGDAVQWAQDDIENLGDWEYRVLELADRKPSTIEAALNEAGDERWEVFWVEMEPGITRFYLKRPAVSYLSRVPLSVLLRTLSGGGQ